MQKSLRHLLVATTAAAVAALSTIALAPSEARACSLVNEEVRWTTPAAGAETVGETPFVVAVGGLPLSGQLRVYDETGDIVADTDGHTPMAGVHSYLYEASPQTPLADGDYTVALEYPNRDDFEFDVTVSEDLDVDGPPGPIDFRWYRETYEGAAGDSCYVTDEFNVVDIEAVDETTRLLHLEFLDDNDDRIGFEYIPPDRIDGRLLDRFEVRDVDCIRVTGIDDAGRTGDIVQHCEPDKCNHFDGEYHHGVTGTTDWSEISGCEADADSGQTDDAARGCASAAGGPAVPAIVVVVVIWALRRWRVDPAG